MRKEIIVPESTAEVPLSRYQKLMLADEEKQKDFRFIFACLTGCDESDVDLVKAKDMDRAGRAIIKALNDTKAPLIKKVVIDGVKYGLEPQLDEISFGMMVDLQSFFDDPGSWHKVVSILYRPIIRETDSLGGLYAIEPHNSKNEGYQQRQQVFKDGPASLFVSLRAFFLTGSMALNHFTHSLKTGLHQKKKRHGSERP